jgi:hypothetical protein
MVGGMLTKKALKKGLLFGELYGNSKCKKINPYRQKGYSKM